MMQHAGYSRMSMLAIVNKCKTDNPLNSIR